MIKDMKYFIIHTDSNYVTAPDLMDWQDKIDRRFIKQGVSYHIPKRELYDIRPNANTVCTDVVSFPLFIVTGLVKEVIQLYLPKLVYKELVLLDRVNKFCEVYHLPILPEVNCLSRQSELSLDRSVLKRGILNERLIKEEDSLFFIGEVRNTYVAARLDIVESILRRGARGVGLTPLETTVE